MQQSVMYILCVLYYTDFFMPSSFLQLYRREEGRKPVMSATYIIALFVRRCAMQTCIVEPIATRQSTFIMLRRRAALSDTAVCPSVRLSVARWLPAA